MATSCGGCALAMSQICLPAALRVLSALPGAIDRERGERRGRQTGEQSNTPFDSPSRTPIPRTLALPSSQRTLEQSQQLLQPAGRHAAAAISPVSLCRRVCHVAMPPLARKHTLRRGQCLGAKIDQSITRVYLMRSSRDAGALLKKLSTHSHLAFQCSGERLCLRGNRSRLRAFHARFWV